MQRPPWCTTRASAGSRSADRCGIETTASARSHSRRRSVAVVRGHVVPPVLEEGRSRDQRRQRLPTVVVLANLSGFDGSPESLRRLQLEYGAEIGRAIVNFDGPFVLCVVSRYHGGAFVVFSGTLNDDMEVLAVEGSFASVIGGAPAAAVVFTRKVDARTRADERIQEVEDAVANASTDESTLRQAEPRPHTRPYAPRSSARSRPSSMPSTACSGPSRSAPCIGSSGPRTCARSSSPPSSAAWSASTAATASCPPLPRQEADSSAPATGFEPVPPP